MLDHIPEFYFLRAKLYRPTLPSDHILRPRLLSMLGRINHQQMAVVIASAGYGKTTLLSAWIEQLHCPHTWLTLDDGDNELPIFLSYFLAAVRSIFPDFGKQILTFSQASTLPSVPTIIKYLLNEIDKIDQDFVVVLDDFHSLTNPDIFVILEGILRYPLPHFHLALTSRYDLPVQLSKLRAHGRMIELRAKDLRFSAAEVADFTEKALTAVLDAETIRILTEKTEGWPVGLRLATIALRRWGVNDYQPAILQVDNQYVVDYLVNEVLARCSTAVIDFLLKSSVLNRFCAPLCAAMMGNETLDPIILPQLEQEGLFIESLDTRKEWFRYHKLFQDLLRRRLEEKVSAAEIANLHLRASSWLAANGRIEEAIDHALLSGDMTAAANILSQSSFSLVEKERWLLLESLLNKFPPEVIKEQPFLLLLGTWLNMTRMQMEHLETNLQSLAANSGAVSLTPVEQRFMDSSMHLFAAFKHTWAAEFEQSIFHAHAALDTMRPEWGLLHAYAFVHLGTATHFLQGGQAGLAILEKKSHWLVPDSVQVRKQIAIAFVDWLSADIGKLLQTAWHGLELLQAIEGFTSGSYLHYFAGIACYEQNDLDKAAHHFNTVLEKQYLANPQPYVLCAIGQALVYQAQNKEDEARHIVQTAVDFCQEMAYPQLLFKARTFQAELALRQGQLDIASLWAAQAEGTPLPKTMPYYYEASMTLPQIWLAEASPASWQKAKTELSRLYEIVNSTHNIPFQIKVLALQSLLYKRQKNAQLAEETLAKAVRLAQPSGFIRIFVDLGSELAALLKHLYMQGFVTTYLQKVIEAFPVSKPTANFSWSPATIESMTDREMEVLNLLAQRLSNKEIANTLIISQETVKRHTSNIYQKLGVKNRRQAVASAYHLGLIVDLT